MTTNVASLGVPGITSIDDIHAKLGGMLGNQDVFLKKDGSPFENRNDAFEVDAEQIDRIYHLVSFEASGSEGYYELFCRTKFNGLHHYVKMVGILGPHGWDCEWCTEGSSLYYSQDPSFYFEHIVCRTYNSVNYKSVVEKIYHTLRSEGCHIKHPSNFETYNEKILSGNKTKKNPLSLQYMIHLSIYNTKEPSLKLKNVRVDVYPKPLLKNIENFEILQNWLLLHGI